MTAIDVDKFTINVAATKEQIIDAPALLDDASEADVEDYYQRLATLNRT